MYLRYVGREGLLMMWEVRVFAMLDEVTRDHLCLPSRVGSHFLGCV